MLTVSDPSVFSTPTIADLNGDLSVAHLGIADDPSAEFDAAEASFAAFQRQDCHCPECGAITAGSVIAGVEVPACDDCLIGFVIDQVDSAKVRDRLFAARPEWLVA